MEYIEAERRMVVTRDQEEGGWGECWSKGAQWQLCQMSKFRDSSICWFTWLPFMVLTLLTYFLNSKNYLLCGFFSSHWTVFWLLKPLAPQMLCLNQWLYLRLSSCVCSKIKCPASLQWFKPRYHISTSEFAFRHCEFENFLLWGVCPMSCRMFSGIVGLYPLNASRAPPPVITTKMSTDIAKCPLGEDTCFSWPRTTVVQERVWR